MNGELVIFRLGKLTYSNCAIRKDIMFKTLAHKHLFWRFWLCIEKTNCEKRIEELSDEILMLQERIEENENIISAQEQLIKSIIASNTK